MSAPSVAKAWTTPIARRSEIKRGSVFSAGATAVGGRALLGAVARAYQYRRSRTSPLRSSNVSAHSAQAKRVAARCALLPPGARNEPSALAGSSGVSGIASRSVIGGRSDVTDMAALVPYHGIRQYAGVNKCSRGADEELTRS